MLLAGFQWGVKHAPLHTTSVPRWLLSMCLEASDANVDAPLLGSCHPASFLCPTLLSVFPKQYVDVGFGVCDAGALYIHVQVME